MKNICSHCSKFVRDIANQKLLEADKECESYTTGLWSILLSEHIQ